MTLGLVIPVHNDQAALMRLLARAADLAIFDRIVVVDDGSDVPVELPTPRPRGLRLIRHETAQGPGPARNAGLAALPCDHVLFFDSDDLLTAELAALWRALQGQAFDFCLFRHADSREFGMGDWRQMPLDEVLWSQARLGHLALAEVTPEARTVLAQTANYPWNKIYRTGFLRSARISFPDVPVHEDITPHWESFLRAGRILASARVGAVHYVDPGGGRQTNRRDGARLQAFDSLEGVWQALQAEGASQDLKLGFLRFSETLINWIHGTLAEALHGALRVRARRFLRAALTPEMAEALITKDPALAHVLFLRLGGEASC